jgi:hypothetical protein
MEWTRVKDLSVAFVKLILNKSKIKILKLNNIKGSPKYLRLQKKNKIEDLAKSSIFREGQT